MAIYWPTPGYKRRTFKLCVLTRCDFNFCIRSSPLRGKDSTPGLIIYKLLEPVLARRRTEGFAHTSFWHDPWQVSETEAESIQNVSATVQPFPSLAFVVHPDKSVLAPTQKYSVPRSDNWLQRNVSLSDHGKSGYPSVLRECLKS